MKTISQFQASTVYLAESLIQSLTEFLGLLRGPITAILSAFNGKDLVKSKWIHIIIRGFPPEDFKPLQGGMKSNWPEKLY